MEKIPETLSDSGETTTKAGNLKGAGVCETEAAFLVSRPKTYHIPTRADLLVFSWTIEMGTTIRLH